MKPSPRVKLRPGQTALESLGLKEVRFQECVDAKMVAKQKDAPVSNQVKDVLTIASVHWHCVEIVGIEPEVKEI